MDFKKIESSLKKLSETELNLKTRAVAKQEQELNLVVLYHLQEVYRRKYFARLGYASVWEYCVKELGYCEAGASHRVQVMKLMFTHREARKEIENKNLSLSQVAKITQFLTREKKETGEAYSPEKTTQLISAVRNKSVRETISHLQQVERSRKEPLWEKSIVQMVSFDADDELMKMMERVRELKGNMATKELMKFVFQQTLERIDPLRRKSLSRKVLSEDRLRVDSVKPNAAKLNVAKSDAIEPNATKLNAKDKIKLPLAKSRGTKSTEIKSCESKLGEPELSETKSRDTKSRDSKTNAPNFSGAESTEAKLEAPEETDTKLKKSLNTFQVERHIWIPNADQELGPGAHRKKQSRYIPKDLHTFVAKRSGGRCEFVSPVGGKRCSSRYRLQIDHARPLSRGGETTRGNLQHLCPAHNSTKGTQEMRFFRLEERIAT